MSNMSLFVYLYMIKDYSENDLELTDLCLANGIPLPDDVKKDIHDYYLLKFNKEIKHA